ncbi:MAG: hypothetical protein L6V93_16825 [Clostridiales bacterium]|nr:MAG: hypothetical protein L6V93_16825 [Clostridiales bacterium]
MFEDENITKISSGIKKDIVLLHGRNIEFNGKYFDTSVGGYILNPSRSNYEISAVANEFLDIEIP